MALPKVCGIETEFGIMVRGAESNPVSASSLLINAYVARVSGRDAARTGWDFNDEQPGSDARGFSLDDVMVPELETNLVNAVLTNGARYYVDHAHPEISNPETTTAFEAVQWDRAAEEIIRISVDAANVQLAQTAQHPGHEIVVYKNNSDGKSNSYGCHENYLLSRQTPFGRLAAQITPHFVTRQIYCGAGKVGTEVPGTPHDTVPFQLSQRADFFEEEIGLETTLKRPIVNTRDEPHADAQKYRRLHVIVGDANMSEVATYLKVGTTAIVLSMIEDDVLGDDWTLAHPVPAIRHVSHDPSLRATVMLSDGRRASALDVQWGLYEAAVKYEQHHGLASVGEDVGRDVLARWEHVLTALESNPELSPTRSTGWPSAACSTAMRRATGSARPPRGEHDRQPARGSTRGPSARAPDAPAPRRRRRRRRSPARGAVRTSASLVAGPTGRPGRSLGGRWRAARWRAASVVTDLTDRRRPGWRAPDRHRARRPRSSTARSPSCRP